MAVNYLYRGNSKMQEMFYLYFKGDIKHDKIEVFEELLFTLNQCFKQVKKIANRRNKDNLNGIFIIGKNEESEEGMEEVQ